METQTAINNNRRDNNSAKIAFTSQNYLHLLEEKLSKNEWHVSLFSTVSAVIFSLIKANKLLNNNHKICFNKITKETRQMFHCAFEDDYSFFKINHQIDLNKINVRGKKGLGVVYLRPSANDMSIIFTIAQTVKTFDDRCVVIIDISGLDLNIKLIDFNNDCVDAIICLPKNISHKYYELTAGIVLIKNQDFTKFIRNLRKCLGNALPEQICEQLLQ